jgi:thiosulfate/3-mercaptopyruvate sulfurtransferase
MNSLFASLLAAAVLACGGGAGHGSPTTLLVTPTWLASHLHDANLVVLAMDQDNFAQGHIPGARPFGYMDTHLMQANGLTLEMPPATEAAQTFAALGVSRSSHIVLYSDDRQLAPVARVFTTLDQLGLGDNVSILDGGFGAWRAAGLPLSSAAAPSNVGSLEACPQNDVVASYEQVRAARGTPGVTIVDARAPEYYSGAKHTSGQRAGHIPGAVNIPFISITHSDGTVKPKAELAALFERAGVKPGQQLIVYCHIGQQANAVRFAARLLGYDAKLYDGSWEDWSRHADAPVAH